MEQQYRMNNPAPKPQSRFMRIWGPVLIKWGIAFAVSVFAMMVFELVMFAKESGIDIRSIQNVWQIQEELNKYMMQMLESSELTNQLMQEFLKYTTPVEGLAALITIPVMLVMFHKDRVKERAAGVVPAKKAELWKYTAVLVMSLAVTLGVNNLIAISGISAQSEAYEDTMSTLYAASFPVQLICLGILVPVCEELVFRGLVFKRLRQMTDYRQAAVYSSVVFGFLHMNLVQMLYGFCLGMIFCYFYEKYGSVKAPVLAHVSANIFSVFMTEYHMLDRTMKEPVGMGIITVLCATVASAMFVLIQRIQENNKENEKN